MSVERTLAIIKPDAVQAGHVGEIITIIERSGLRILSMKMKRLSRREAEEFYAVHRDKPFYESLVRFMTEGPVVLLALEGENAIEKWRQIMGPTDPAKAGDGTIRKLFGTNIERNAVHGSDQPATAAQEVPFFFSTAELL